MNRTISAWMATAAVVAALPVALITVGPVAAAGAAVTCESSGSWSVRNEEDSAATFTVEELPGQSFAVDANGSAEVAHAGQALTVHLTWTGGATDKVVGEGDCAKYGLVQEPTYTPPTCEAAGTVEAADTDDYTWERTEGDGSVSFRAVARAGITLDGATEFGPYAIAQLEGDDCAPMMLAADPPPTADPTCASTHITTVTNLDDVEMSGTGATASIVPGAIKLTTTPAGYVYGWVVPSDGTKIGSVLDVDWTGTGTSPGVVLYIYGADDSYVGALLGEPDYYGQTYWTPSGGGLASLAPVQGGTGNGSPYFGTQAEWQHVLDTNQLHIGEVAFNLGSGVTADGSLISVTGGCETIVFDLPTADPTCPADIPVTYISDWSQLMTPPSVVRSAGHYEFVADGLRIWTDDDSNQAKVAGFVPGVGSRLGSSVTIDWAGQSGGIPPGGHIQLSDGSILIAEPDYYSNVLWANGGSPIEAHAPQTGGGYGSNYFGTPAQWQAVIDDLGLTITAVGFSLGSGVHNDGVLSSITVGCQTIRFGQPPASSTTSTTIESSTTTVQPSTTIELPTTTSTTTTSTTTTVPVSVTADVQMPQVVQGAVQVGIGRGFQPGEVVTGQQLSTPLALGSQVADANGMVRFTWVIRADETLGAHQFVVTGATSGTASARFEVIAGSGELPKTA